MQKVLITAALSLLLCACENNTPEVNRSSFSDEQKSTDSEQFAKDAEGYGNALQRSPDVQAMPRSVFKFSFNKSQFTTSSKTLVKGSRVVDLATQQRAIVVGTITVLVNNKSDLDTLMRHSSLQDLETVKINRQVFRVKYPEDTDLESAFQTIIKIPSVEQVEIDVTYISPNELEQ